MRSPSINPVKIMSRAYDYAARKCLAAGRDPTTTMLELASISRLLAEVTDGKDKFLVAAGILSAVPVKAEDQTLDDDIEARFGVEISTLVRESRLPSRTEPRRRLLHARGLSEAAALIVMTRFIATLMDLQRQAVPSDLEKPLDRLEDMARMGNALRGTRHLLGLTFSHSLVACLDRVQIKAAENAAKAAAAPAETAKPATAKADTTKTDAAKAGDTKAKEALVKAGQKPDVIAPEKRIAAIRAIYDAPSPKNSSAA